MEQGLGVRLNFACMSLSVPLSPSKNTQKTYSAMVFFFFSPRFDPKQELLFFPSSGRRANPRPELSRLKHCLNRPPCAPAVYDLSSHAPHSFFPSVPFSLVLPWMVFLKWQSRRSLPNPVAPWKRLVRLRSTYFPKGPNWTPFSNEVWSLTSSIVTRPVLYLSQWRYPQWWRECSFFWDNN